MTTTSLVSALVLLIWLQPRISSYFNILQARQLLADIKLTARLANKSILCTVPISIGIQSKEDLDNNIQMLEESVHKASGISESYLLLGQFLCLNGRSDEAVGYLETYTHMEKDDQLGHLELSAVYETICQEQSQESSRSNASPDDLWPGICGDDKFKDLIFNEWRLAAAVSGNFQNYAEQDFQGGRFLEASHWYQKAAILGENLSRSDFIKWSLASIYSGRDLPQTNRNRIPVTRVSKIATIEGEDLYWTIENPSLKLTFGSQLNDFPSTEPEVGVMWWRGAAVSFIDIATPGIYKIMLKVKGQGPGPLLVQIERNLTPIDILTVHSGEEDWQEISAAGFFQEGLYTLGARLVEDRGNVFIDWIRLELVQVQTKSQF